MGIDKANIFRLDEETFKEYEKDPFLDCFESTKQFAQALKLDIETKETPHTLLLSADYGMGKTFFSTRFTQFLRNENFDVIYFSVWENDYMKEPFVAFSKAIVNYISNRFKTKKLQNNINVHKLFSVIKEVICAVSLDIGVKSFFHIKVSGDKLINIFKKPVDPVLKFRKQLTDFISKLKNKKLILIVDELDRCRPDYAMKTLECIKHFFDVEGLFVILPTNINALNNCTKSLYGFDNCNKQDKENYFKKFFNDERTIKKPTVDDYSFILRQVLNDNMLQEAIDKKLLVKDEEKFNNLNILYASLAKYAHSAGLTIREFKDTVIETVRLCNNFYEPVRVEWLTCLMTYKGKNTASYPLPEEHCFYHESRTGATVNKKNKGDILRLTEYSAIFNKLRSTYDDRYRSSRSYYINLFEYRSFMKKYREIPKEINGYKDTGIFLNKVINEIETLEKSVTCNTFYYELMLGNLFEIKEAILKQRDVIKRYQDKYGSDDNDSVREKQYVNIVQNPECLYSIKVE